MAYVQSGAIALYFENVPFGVTIADEPWTVLAEYRRPEMTVCHVIEADDWRYAGWAGGSCGSELKKFVQETSSPLVAVAEMARYPVSVWKETAPA